MNGYDADVRGLVLHDKRYYLNNIACSSLIRSCISLHTRFKAKWNYKLKCLLILVTETVQNCRNISKDSVIIGWIGKPEFKLFFNKVSTIEQ